eukprot:6925971-Alexandrium_andersonii.AAC.1
MSGRAAAASALLKGGSSSHAAGSVPPPPPPQDRGLGLRRYLLKEWKDGGLPAKGVCTIAYLATAAGARG